MLAQDLRKSHGMTTVFKDYVPRCDIKRLSAFPSAWEKIISLFYVVLMVYEKPLRRTVPQKIALDPIL